MINSEIIKLLFLTSISFVVAMLGTPLLTRYLYKNKCWKKEVRSVGLDGKKTPIFSKLHKNKETRVPRLGGVLIWGTVLIITVICSFSTKLNFLSRSETWIPFFTLIAGSLLGLADDLLVIKGVGNKKKGGGIPFRYRLSIVTLIGLLGACWFYFKLDWDIVFIPFWKVFEIGWMFIPLFVLVMVAVFSSAVIDGLDGLSGGVMVSLFATLCAISFAIEKYDLAIFCGVVLGALLAFLWFNIPPARFYMSETGILGLTITVSVIAFLTNSVLYLPLIAFVLFIESLSVIIQIISKKFFNKKAFLSAPIHHHFQAKGWSESKVVMRFWLISGIASMVGLMLYLFDRL